MNALNPIFFVVIGALLGTQNGRDIEIVNTFELVLEGELNAANDSSVPPEATVLQIDHGFLTTRRDQCESTSIMWRSLLKNQKINRFSLRWRF
jgi:COP9 signalosome complex subunit 6